LILFFSIRIKSDFVCLGIGTVFGSLVVAYARNPSLKQQLFSYAILGFALSEAMGLFCLMMAFMLLFAF
jgi:F-type H+-transporting ATPase subunit c